MPYRRLPNTDSARMRALRAICEQKSIKDGLGLPFSNKTLNEVQNFIPLFENALSEYKQAILSQTSKSKKYQNLVKNARMYISHFIQVLNLACIRNEIKPEKKLLYKLLPDNNSIPDLSTEMLLIEWGKNIIEGESERTRGGGAPIYNPAIAKVSVHYDLFKEAYQSKKIAQKNGQRFLESLQIMRDKADAIILDLWNQIEKSFSPFGVEEMQRLSREYGIIYYLRRKERQALKREEISSL